MIPDEDDDYLPLDGVVEILMLCAFCFALLLGGALVTWALMGGLR